MMNDQSGNLLDVKCDTCDFEIKNTNTLYRDENQNLSIQMKKHEIEHSYHNKWILNRHE